MIKQNWFLVSEAVNIIFAYSISGKARCALHNDFDKVVDIANNVSAHLALPTVEEVLDRVNDGRQR